MALIKKNKTLVCQGTLQRFNMCNHEHGELTNESGVATCLEIDAFSLQSHGHSHSRGQIQGDGSKLLLGSVRRVQGKSTLDCDGMLVNLCTALLQQSI